MNVVAAVAYAINTLRSLMMPQELSLSDATIWSIALESSIMILEASFTLIFYIYSIGITYDDCQSIIH